MKSFGVREVKDHLSDVLSGAQDESVMVLSHGRPEAIIIGIRGTDPTTAGLAELHRRRLSRDTISGEELSARLGIDPREEAKWRREAEAEIARSRRRR
jgi:antitoxin (DNA-binding transcriptional repressor) of toxin-antitoxin stability system